MGNFVHQSKEPTKENYPVAPTGGYRYLQVPQRDAVMIFECLLLHLMTYFLIYVRLANKVQDSWKGSKRPQLSRSHPNQKLHTSCKVFLGNDQTLTDSAAEESGDGESAVECTEEHQQKATESHQQKHFCKAFMPSDENIALVIESSPKDFVENDLKEMSEKKGKSAFMDLIRLDYTDSPIPPVESHVYYNHESNVTAPTSSSRAVETDGGPSTVGVLQDLNTETASSEVATPIDSARSIVPILDKIANDEMPTPHITMKYELLRLCTLRNFPQNNKPYLTRIASAGFYYAGVSDEVICYACGVRRKDWTESDDPFKIHKQLSPNCRFIKNNSNINFGVPNVMNDSIRDKFAKLDAIPEPSGRLGGAEGRSSSIVRPTNLTSGSQISQRASQGHKDRPLSARQLEINTAMPKHPNYAIKATRLASFNGWPDTASQTPEVLATCGFYYAGFGDCVRCFFCGTGLRHWEKDDDPFIEHARWSKDCVYLNNVKGREFVELVHMAVALTEEPVNQDGASGGAIKIPNDEISRLLTSDAAQSVLQMGYEPKIIKEAIAVVLKEKGREGITSESIMRAVFDLEEKSADVYDTVEHIATASSGPMSESVTCSNSNHGQPKEEMQPNNMNQTKKQSITKKTKDSGSVKKQASSMVDSEKGPSSLEELRRENKRLKAQSFCSECKVSENCIVFLPCGHLVTCEPCSKKLKYCSSCNSYIKGTVRTYMS